PGRVDRSLKSLYATGLFADVAIRQDGDRLVVAVTENPIINRVAFEGNDELDDETLTAETSLRPRVIYTRPKVQSDVDRILNLYRRSGRFAATVDPKIIRLEQN
ncbi:POTRA domain-containing protein, partial [Elizabethkingia meningoseptica]|uniref:POTRA domain-containing protein n=1 Tax=Elizabethkingia meningoseptica TaxID=238 RepID=UPI003191EAB9